jgi:hypothetical protein
MELNIEGGKHWWCLVRLGGVLIDSSRSLGAKVAGLGVKIECVDAVFTMGARELYAAIHPLGTVSIHCMNCNLLGEGRGAR